MSANNITFTTKSGDCKEMSSKSETVLTKLGDYNEVSVNNVPVPAKSGDNQINTKNVMVPTKPGDGTEMYINNVTVPMEPGDCKEMNANNEIVHTQPGDRKEIGLEYVTVADKADTNFASSTEQKLDNESENKKVHEAQVVVKYERFEPNKIGALFDLCVARGWGQPEFDVVYYNQFSEQNRFKMSCKVFSMVEIGVGRNKKMAKRNAAEIMWARVKDMPEPDYVSQLYALVVKYELHIIREDNKFVHNINIFTYEVNTALFVICGFGNGRTEPIAKQMAAKNAIYHLSFIEKKLKAIVKSKQKSLSN